MSLDFILLIILGVALLVAGAELLVRASAFLANRLGISPLVIGLTIVAAGTSAPELVASVSAALRGSPGIAIGNIVGSNIANATLVAGAAALVAPLAISSAAIRRDGTVALGAACLFWMICAMQALNAMTGALLLLGQVAYVALSYRSEVRGPASGGAVFLRGSARTDPAAWFITGSPIAEVTATIGCFAGIGLLALGGNFLIEGATSLASVFGVSEAVIGLTIVAVGTSLPELATSVLAALRGRPEIAAGNIIGSNIFNVLGIGGVTALLSHGQQVPERIVRVDFPIMVAAMLVLLLFAMTNRRLGRVEAIILLGSFGLYSASAWLFGGAV